MSVSALTGHTSILGATNLIFGFPGVSGNVDFGNFSMGLGVWEALQTIGNGCGLEMDGFSAHCSFRAISVHFDDFQDFSDFALVSDGLTVLPEGPGTLSEGLGTL